jgi:Fe-S oxidoreductase
VAVEDYRNVMIRCTRCSYCKWIPFDHVKSIRFAKGCPAIAYNNFQSYSAGGRLIAALSLLEGRSSYTDGLLDIVYNCQLCGSCDVACKICRYDMEPLEAMRELRAKLVEDGQLLPQHMLVIDNLRKEDTMILGKVKADRGKWADGLDVKDLTKERAEVAFHAGCRFCYVEAWTTAGVKTVVTSCSDGYFAFKRLYPEVSSKFEVLHTVEFIDRLIKEGKLKLTKTIPMKVTYHDPCHLGRMGEPYIPWKGVEKRILGQMVVHEPKKPRYNGAWGIYDPPRDVLKSIPGLELVEMERIREYAWCCGAGGGVTEAYPEFSSWTAAERITEAESTGAEAIVSACPWCERNFIDSISANGQKLKVYDVIELVQQAI